MPKITAIETSIPADIMTNLILVRVHTEDGHIGCGETYYTPQAIESLILQETVRAHIRTFYDKLIDRQPLIENGWLIPPSDPGLGTAFLSDLFRSGKNNFRRSEIGK